MILLAILLPPLYFLLNKRAGMALLTGAMFVISIFLAMTVVLLPGSLAMWLVSALLAVWHYRRRDREEHAEMLATKMAEKMRDTRGTPPVIPPKQPTLK
jgi:1,4-dihydroxy-2-naphthoate octaprenyltransferase